jgi:hydroxysqualene synthase
VSDAAAFASGKGHRDENFPVASWLVRRELRAAILAFYRFARAADDVADHPDASSDRKLEQLARMERALRGGGGNAEGTALRAVLETHDLTDRHALDLLEAFRRDVTKKRYVDWAELMDYCRYSAAPVGRFVLDLHGEASSLWPANDALCMALQMINHLQDCGKDLQALDRVYVPLDALAAHGATVGDLSATHSSPALRRTLEDLASRTAALLVQSRCFAPAIADHRLALEVGAIQALAENLARLLARRDPLSERVHHHPAAAAGLSLCGAFKIAIGWLT